MRINKKLIIDRESTCVSVSLIHSQIVVIRNSTGSRIHYLPGRSFVFAASDGQNVVGIDKSGAAFQFDGITGTFKRRFNRRAVVNCSVVNGIVTLSYVDGTFARIRLTPRRHPSRHIAIRHDETSRRLLKRFQEQG